MRVWTELGLGTREAPVYPGVPTFDFGRLSFSCFEYPKSQIFNRGRRLPSSRVFCEHRQQHAHEVQPNVDATETKLCSSVPTSSLISRLTMPIL